MAYNVETLGIPSAWDIHGMHPGISHQQPLLQIPKFSHSIYYCWKQLLFATTFHDLTSATFWADVLEFSIAFIKAPVSDHFTYDSISPGANIYLDRIRCCRTLV